MNILEKINLKEKRILLITISYFKSIILGICKIILAIFSKSLLLFISSFYNIGIGIAKRESIKESKKDEYSRYLFVGIIVLISSIVYVIYSLYGYMYGMNPKYHMYIAIGIAAVTFTDLTLAIIGIIKAKKSKNIKAEILKLINLSTALISLALTQTALLSFTMEGDISKFCGIGGMLFGILAGIVGIYMIIYISRNKKRIIG